MRAIKGFDKDLKCRGHQFAVGESYEESEASICERGYHACLRPLDVFAYYPPATSRYCAVDIDDNGERREEDTKVCGKKIEIKAELSLCDLVNAQIKYVKSNCTTEIVDLKAATAGDGGAATAGDGGAATARGSVTVGKNGCGLVRGNGVKARGDIGSVLVICIENEDGYGIKELKTAIVDGKAIKANTYYTLKNGDFVEV